LIVVLGAAPAAGKPAQPDPGDEISAQLQLAEELRGDDAAQALQHVNSALALARRQENLPQQAEALLLLGKILDDQSEHEQAKQHLEEARRLFAQLQDVSGEAGCLMALGLTSYRLNDLEQAISHYEEALALHRRVGPPQDLLKNLTNLGLMYRRLFDFDTALPYYRQALEIAQETGDQVTQVQILNNIGRCLKNLDDLEEARQAHEQALAISTAGDDVEGQMYALLNLGQLSGMQGDFLRTKERFEQALALARQLGDPQSIAMNLGNLGTVYLDLDQYDKAEASLLEALELFKQLGNERDVASTLDNLGSIYNSMGRFTDSLEHHLKALEVRERLGDKQHIANSYNNLGVVYDDLGQYETALEYYLKALALREEISDRRGIATTLGNIGIICKLLQDYDKAQTYDERALRMYEQLGDQVGMTRILGNLGNLAHAQGQDDRALEYHSRSLELARQLEYQSYIANSLSSIGVVYEAQGKLEAAIDHYQQALALNEQIGDRRGVASCLSSIGNVFLLKQAPRQAITSYRKALDIARSSEDKPTLAALNKGLSEASAKLDDFSNAYSYLVRYTQINEELVNAATTKRIAELEAVYELQSKQKEITLLAKDNELLQSTAEIQQLRLSKQRLISRVMFVGLFLLGVCLLLLLKRYHYLFTFWRRRSFIGHYRLLDRIGSGGIGVVYRASHVMEKGRSVAIKVIRDELAEDEHQRRRFLHEATLIDQLNHPNIVKVHERGEYDHRLYIAMEMLEGVSLADRIAQAEPIPLPQALEIMRQLTSALTAIHDKGILHRDLKPENVMLVPENEDQQVVKLLDFGLAKNQTLTRLTATGEILGTVFYLPPEQITLQQFTTHSDIYSLGVIFYEIVTREKPFMGEQPLDIIKQILEHEPLPPSSFNARIDPELDTLIMAMLSKDPQQRPTASAVQQILDEQTPAHPASTSEE